MLDPKVTSAFIHLSCKTILSIMLICSISGAELKAQDCDNFAYFLSLDGFGCDYPDGQVCLTMSQDYADLGCGENYHFELSWDNAGAVVTDIDPFYYIDDGNISGTEVLRYDPVLFYDSESRVCFDLSQLTPRIITVEVVNNNDPNDRRFIQTAFAGPGTTLVAPNQSETVSSLVSSGALPPGGANGRFLIEGELIVDVPYHFGSSSGLPYSNLDMGDNARITIAQNQNLGLIRTFIKPCGTQWDRIRVEENASLSFQFSEIVKANVGIDAGDGSEVLLFRSSISQCNTAISAVDPGPSGPTLRFGAGRIGAMSIFNCTNGIQLHNAGDQVVAGNLSIVNMSSTGISVTGQGTSLLAGGAIVPGTFPARFLIRNCATSGIRASDGVESVSVLSGAIENCNVAIGSFGVGSTRVRNMFLQDNNNALLSSQYSPPIFSFFRPVTTFYDVAENEFLGNTYDVVGIEFESSGIFTDNTFALAGEANLVLFGSGNSRQRWFIHENREFNATSRNFWLNNARNTVIEENALIEADRNGVVDGGESIEVSKNDASTFDDLNFLGNASPLMTIECNEWSGGLNMQYLGGSSGSAVLGNTLNAPGTELNLALGSPAQSFAMIGPQINAGNIFQINNQIVKARAFTQNPDEFVVTGNQPGSTVYFPYHDPGGWFTGGFADPFACGPMRPPVEPGVKIKEAAEQELAVINTGSLSPTNTADVELKLHRHLLMLPDSMLSPSLADAKQDLQLRTWANLSEAQANLLSASEVLAQTQAIRDQLQDELRDHQLAVANVYPYIPAVDGLSAVIDPQAVTSLDSLLALQTAAFSDYTASLADGASAQNTALADAQVALQTTVGENVVTSAAIDAMTAMLSLATGDTPTSTLENNVRFIAAQCPSEFGEAVFTARTVVAALDESVPSFFSLCDESGVNDGSPVSTQEVRSTEKIILSPNYTTGGASVQLELPSDFATPQQLELIDSRGVVVRSVTVRQQVDQITTAGLVPGIYIARLVHQDLSAKLIIASGQ